ncbi:MAG: SiaC family regulatory phosphoprotein [Bacteroidales bacterium]|nr:SiaC family regulatory phosphoprotein [Bacteroidales bacterium]
MGWFVSGNKTKEITQDTPNVTVRERLKKVEISGRSRMTDPCDFYEELQRTLESCYNAFHKTLFLDFYLEYINTGSSKLIYHMLCHLQSLKDNEGILEVNWYYEEDDEIIQEAGEVLESLLSVPFHMREI